MESPIEIESGENHVAMAKTWSGFPKVEILENAVLSHKFYKYPIKPVNKSEFVKAYQRDIFLLEDGLPPGILVKFFEDRMDLISALISGPKDTPYEGGLFAFEIQLPAKYPSYPPLVHYVSFTRTINPNLYTCGTVCLSLLGTWISKHSCERWTNVSSILQILISIQGLIFVQNPFFNEPGVSWFSDKSEQCKTSKEYNERVVFATAYATVAMLDNPPLPWQRETSLILRKSIPRTITRLECQLRRQFYDEPLKSLWRTFIDWILGLFHFTLFGHSLLPYISPAEIRDLISQLKKIE